MVYYGMVSHGGTSSPAGMVLQALTLTLLPRATRRVFAMQLVGGTLVVVVGMLMVTMVAITFNAE